MRIIFHPEVENYLSDLVEILYKKEYFGFEDMAIKYVDNLIDDIVDNIHRKQKKTAPPFFSKYNYGNELLYITYRRNRNTQWYVFFNYEDETYYINYIANNHTTAQYL